MRLPWAWGRSCSSARLYVRVDSGETSTPIEMTLQVPPTPAPLRAVTPPLPPQPAPPQPAFSAGGAEAHAGEDRHRRADRTASKNIVSGEGPRRLKLLLNLRFGSHQGKNTLAAPRRRAGRARCSSQRSAGISRGIKDGERTRSGDFTRRSHGQR